jgi:hypothetical protein
MRPRKFREVNRQHSGKNVSNRLLGHRAPGVGLQEVAEKKKCTQRVFLMTNKKSAAA